jgi:hypothetical protein
MFQNLRLKKPAAPPPYSPFDALSRELLAGTQEPVGIRYLNHFEDGLKARIYRSLVPPHLLRLYEIDPLRWTKFGKPGCVRLDAAPDTDRMVLAISNQPEPFDPYFVIELQDNIVGGIDLNWLQLSDPFATRYAIDRDEAGKDTSYGTTTRNLSAEAAALDAGLAPAQIRAGVGASQLVFTQLETFLAVLGQQALFLEPLTYASAWVFERRGFAYVRGHKLMDDIHQAFQLGGALRTALDGSTPFRQQGQWHSIRGRAWAIHDGVLDALGATWDQLRMIKQIGKHAGVNTAGNTPY